MAEYPISSGELLQIAMTEVAKQVPVLGAIAGAHKEVFNQIELNRVRALLVELTRKVDHLSDRLAEPRKAEIALFACDVVRGDPLVGSKADVYAGVVAEFFNRPDADMEVVVEIIDNLRKLNVGDLKVLYRFKNAAVESLPMESIADLQPGYVLDTVISEGRRKMTAVLPHIARLESLGILYRASDISLAGPVLDIGPLSSEIKKRAHLTDAGKRLVEHLPP